MSPCLIKHRSKSPGRRRDVARKFWASVIPASHAMLVCVSQYVPQKCLQTHHHVSPPTFGVDILLLKLYSNIYKGIRSFVLVPWMQRQCPVCRHTLSPVICYRYLHVAQVSREVTSYISLTFHPVVRSFAADHRDL